VKLLIVFFLTFFVAMAVGWMIAKAQE